MKIPACQALFGSVRGRQIQDAIEEDTGRPCPCAQGLSCPLLASPKLEPLPHAS